MSLIPPLDYLGFVNLMKRSALILTDSGGIQEEAPSPGVPVLVMRERTERPEGIEAGGVRLVGRTQPLTVAEADRLLSDSRLRASTVTGTNPCRDGRAAERIVSHLQSL